MRRRNRAVVMAGVVVLASAVTGGALALARDEPDPDAVKPTALLLETGEWHSDIPGFDDASVSTGTHVGLSGKPITTRLWTVRNSEGTLTVRQFVQRQEDDEEAHDVFVDEDDGPIFRKKLGGADKLTVTSAPHADEAVGYCVSRAPRCSILSYRMRYGAYLVEFSMADGGFTTTSGEAMLETLDRAVASRLA
ncbi:hypothetical protein [Actinoplanes sp. NPDC049316]|uniref:hypothetical protein n=1 Tax=Actinoplanes sp. NPDC049316 TaxID=3154727 RepID=UPI0034155096